MFDFATMGSCLILPKKKSNLLLARNYKWRDLNWNCRAKLWVLSFLGTVLWEPFFISCPGLTDNIDFGLLFLKNYYIIFFFAIESFYIEVILKLKLIFTSIRLVWTYFIVKTSYRQWVHVWFWKENWFCCLPKITSGGTWIEIWLFFSRHCYIDFLLLFIVFFIMSIFLPWPFGQHQFWSFLLFFIMSIVFFFFFF
jgi:hypothetical protein